MYRHFIKGQERATGHIDFKKGQDRGAGYRDFIEGKERGTGPGTATF